MYTLFTSDSNQDKITTTIPKFNSVKKIIEDDSQKIIDYYKDYQYLIDRNHLIVKILTFLNVSFKRNFIDYVETAREKTAVIAKRLKLIHPLNPNVEKHNGAFYNEQTTEYIIASDDEFDLVDAIKHWGYMPSIKVHTHPFTDFSYSFANSKYKSNSENGVAVISINIPLLALQWRMFCRVTKHVSDFHVKANAFATRFVMLNTLYGHIQHTIINRFMGYYLQRPLASYIRQHNVFVSDITSRLDETILQMVDVVNKKKLELNEVFTTFPSFRHASWSEAIRLPDLPTTQYTKWIYIVTYLPYVMMYLTMVKNNKSALDRDVLFTIKRNIQYLENSRGMILPLDKTSANNLLMVKSLLADITA